MRECVPLIDETVPSKWDGYDKNDDDIAKFKKLNNTIDIGNNSRQMELKLKFRWSILLLENKNFISIVAHLY